VTTIAHHRTRRRRSTGTASVEHDLACGIGLDEDRVEGSAYGCERMASRQHRRVHPHDHAFIRALGDSQQLDDEAHLLCGADVVRCHAGDALAVDVVERDPGMKGQLGEDRRLGRGVMPVDVEARIGFEVTQGGRLGKHVVVLDALLVHLGEHVVRRAVDDAEHTRDAVARQRFAKRAQQGMAPATAASKYRSTPSRSAASYKVAPSAASRALFAVIDAGPGSHRRKDQAASGLYPAHDLDDDVSPAGGHGGRRRHSAAASGMPGRDRDASRTATWVSVRGAPTRSAISCALSVMMPRDLRAHGPTAEEGHGAAAAPAQG